MRQNRARETFDKTNKLSISEICYAIHKYLRSPILLYTFRNVFDGAFSKKNNVLAVGRRPRVESDLTLGDDESVGATRPSRPPRPAEVFLCIAFDGK